MTIEVTNSDLHKESLEDLQLSNDLSVVISRIVRNQRTIIATSDVVLWHGDQIVVIGSAADLNRLCQ